VETYFFEDDLLAKALANYIGRRNVIQIKPFNKIDFSKKFIVLNGSNYEHHRTLEILKNISGIDGYFHIDNHDDIQLGSSSSTKVGSANWVGHLLSQLELKVVFVGQRYWTHHLNFRGREYVGLFRNNLNKYRPISSIYFICSNEDFLVWCDKRTLAKLTSSLNEIVFANNIERVYVLDELLELMKRETYSNKVNVYTKHELIWHEESEAFQSMYPVFLIEWKKIGIDKLPLKNVYVSIDLDVLKRDLIETDTSSETSIFDLQDLTKVITEIRKKYNIVGADICGLSYKEKRSMLIINKIYRSLMESML